MTSDYTNNSLKRSNTVQLLQAYHSCLNIIKYYLFKNCVVSDYVHVRSQLVARYIMIVSLVEQLILLFLCSYGYIISLIPYIACKNDIYII